MPSSQVIMWMIVCCAVFASFLLFGKPFKFLAKTAASALLGAVCMTAFNFVLSPLGVSVGINAVTLLVVGILGAPGFVTLYAASVAL